MQSLAATVLLLTAAAGSAMFSVSSGARKLGFILPTSLCYGFGLLYLLCAAGVCQPQKQDALIKGLRLGFAIEECHISDDLTNDLRLRLSSMTREQGPQTSPPRRLPPDLRRFLFVVRC
jgi:hypothetical protein